MAKKTARFKRYDRVVFVSDIMSRLRGTDVMKILEKQGFLTIQQETHGDYYVFESKGILYPESWLEPILPEPRRSGMQLQAENQKLITKTLPRVPYLDLRKFVKDLKDYFCDESMCIYKQNGIGCCGACKVSIILDYCDGLINIWEEING